MFEKSVEFSGSAIDVYKFHRLLGQDAAHCVEQGGCSESQMILPESSW